MLGLYFLLLLASLPMWFWLCARIWKVNPFGAKISFILAVPALYWTFKLWDDPEAKIRPAAFANLALVILIVLVHMQLPEDWVQTLTQGSEYSEAKHRAEKKRKNSDMERWCQEKNDASYDADLDTCVERNKTEALALGTDTKIFSRLTTHLEKSGVNGEFDHSKSAASIKLAKSVEIADVASYYFLPFSMSQPTISVYLCISASGCVSFVENIKDHSSINMIRNNNLLMTIPWDSMEEPRIKELTTAFLNFKPV